MTLKTKANWYKKNIEEPIRKQVKLLRDNGFNTTCSCGHSMIVECEFLIQDDCLGKLYKLLYNNGYRNFAVSGYISVYKGHPNSFIDVDFSGNTKSKIYNKGAKQ